MGASIQILLTGIILLSSSWSVVCASLPRHFRPVRDVEFPFIHNVSIPTASTPTSTTLLQQDNIKELNISTVPPVLSRDLTSQSTEQLNKINHTIIKENEDKIVSKEAETDLTKSRKGTTKLLNFEPSKDELKVDQISKDSSKIPTVKALNFNRSKEDEISVPKVPEPDGTLKSSNLDISKADLSKEDTDLSKVPQGASLNLDLSKDLSKTLKNQSKDDPKTLSKDDLKELAKISQGSARSLNFDIDKYTSPDFHNKNNVYTLPTSPEIEKYIEADAHDFASEVTKPTIQKKYYHSTPTKYDTDLTTPHTFFDSKFQNVADGIKQYLEDFEVTHSQKFEDNLEKYDVPTLMENAKNADNETKVTLETKEFKNFEVKSGDAKGLKDATLGSNVNYSSTYLKTRTYEVTPEIDTTVANTISDVNKTKDSQISPSISERKITTNATESTTKSATLAPTKKSRQQSLRNNTIDTAPELKPKHFKMFSSTTPYDLDLIRETERLFTKSNGNNITKRGSTKYFEATTPSTDFHLDIDGKNFSIPPTATAWSLASFKEVPSTTGYKYLKDVSSTPETEQNLQENQLVKIELLPTKIADSTTELVRKLPEISTDSSNLDLNSSNNPSTEFSTTQSESLLELSTTQPLDVIKESTEAAFSSTTESIRVEVPSSSEQSNVNAITKDDISNYSPQVNTSSQSTQIYRFSTDESSYSANITTENKTSVDDSEDALSTENIINETTEITEFRTVMGTELNSKLEADMSSTLSAEFSTEPSTKMNSEFNTDTNYSTTEPDEKMMSDSTNTYEDMSSVTTAEAPIELASTSQNIDLSTTTDSWTTEQYTSSPINLGIISNLTDTTNWNASADEGTPKTATSTEENNDSSTIEEDTKTISSKTESENELYTTFKTPMNHTTKNPKIQSSTEIDSENTSIDVSTLEPIEEVIDTIHEKNVETNANPVDDRTTTTKQPVSTTSEDNSSDNTSSTEQLADDDEDGNNNTGMIAAIAISTVGGICLVILVGLLLIMRKRQKRVTYGQRCRPVSLDAYSLDNVSVYNSVRRKGALRASKRSYGNPAFDDPVSISHQMNFQTLAKFADTPEEISTEFEEIPQVTARANEVPAGCETKNRYANVIPLPETRVFLMASDNDPHNDYINANYVTGPKNIRGYYIACQAPMQNTVDDFWRMIWEQQCRVVLMLTNLYENGVEKCVDYLPPSEVLDCHRLFGDFQITLKKREVKEKYIISNLQLKNMVSNSWREITHLWYLGWPERGVPNEANSLIAFLIEARSHLKAASNNNSNDKISETTNINMSGVSGADGGPLVVHCSPGTGRTGTVIACDIAIRDFELTRAVDIPKIVYRVRRDRASAVQTREQYSFIYQLITLYATKLTGGALDSI